MPPPIQSTSWTSLAKQAFTQLRTAANAQQYSRHVQIGRNAIQTLKSTFPSLSLPSHTSHFTPPPAFLYARNPPTTASATAHFRRAARLNGDTSNPFHHASRGFRTYVRPGMTVPTQVGLGSARTFASGAGAGGGGGGQALHAKVPMMLRAMASAVDDLEEEGYKLKTREYRPYKRVQSRRLRAIRSEARAKQLARHQLRNRAASFASSLVDSIDSGVTATLRNVVRSEHSRYWVLRREAQLDNSITFPPLPEQLVTPGRVAILTLPLGSMYDVLSPAQHSRALPHYDETELGISIFAKLFQGQVELSELHDAQQNRIIPIMNKLKSLGVLDPIDAKTAIEQDVTFEHHAFDGHRKLESMRLTFHGRAASDVKAILGESLRQGEEEIWWILEDFTEAELYGTRTLPVAEQYSEEERKEMLENWVDAVRPLRSSHTYSYPTPPSTAGLVFPELDIPASPRASTHLERNDEFSDAEDTASWLAHSISVSTAESSAVTSGMTTPLSLSMSDEEMISDFGSGVYAPSAVSSISEALEMDTDMDMDSDSDLDLADPSWSASSPQARSEISALATVDTAAEEIVPAHLASLMVVFLASAGIGSGVLEENVD